MIRIEHLRKRFKRIYALDDVSAEIRRGMVLSLIGPNGSGKTTLIKCLLGMVKADSGDIYFEDKLVSNDYAYRSKIGYMPQIGRYPDNMIIGQVLEMIKNIRGCRAEHLDLDLYNAFDIDRIKDKTMRSLSGGTRQKISATLAFMFDPEVYILDEPTAGLDPVASEILKDKINIEKKRGKLMVITSHILSDLEELTTDILYLHEGKVQFFDSLNAIREMTGEEKLSKAVSRFMQQGFREESKLTKGMHKTNRFSS